MVEVDLSTIEIHPRICRIPVPKSMCEDAMRKCEECPYKDNCDCSWIYDLWMEENEITGKGTLLGPFNPAFIKRDFRVGRVLTLTSKYDFCRFNVPKRKDVVVISDIYIDPKLRGQGLGYKVLDYLMQTYDRDIFAKCVKDTTAETFWKHLGYQVDANIDDSEPHDYYQHRPGKRDLGWYRIKNPHKKYVKETLF